RAHEPEVAAMAAGAFLRKQPVPQFTEEGFFEYHLYTLDRRATVADNESKQMELLAARGIGLTKKFLVVGQPAWFRSKTGDLGRNPPAGVSLELKTPEKNPLGMPLPAGTVRVYNQDKSGAQQLVGEDRIRHTPRDETVTVKTGDAFDVVATRTQTDYKALNTKPWDAEVAFEVQLRNHKSEAITVTLREPVGGDHGDARGAGGRRVDDHGVEPSGDQGRRAHARLRGVGAGRRRSHRALPGAARVLRGRVAFRRHPPCRRGVAAHGDAEGDARS